MVESSFEQKEWPAVTVVIPVWNKESCIDGTLESIFSMDYPKYEVIVVDDGSTDKTTEIVANFPVRLIRHVQNEGVSCARNAGVQAARFDLIYFVDGDVVIRKETLRQLVSTLMANEKIGVVAGPYVSDLTDENLARRTYDVVERARDFNQGARECPYVNVANTVMKKDLFEKLGGFDPSFAFTEDFDLTYRIHKMGYVNFFEPKAIAIHNNHRTSLGKYLSHTYEIGKFGTLFRLKYRPELPYSRYLIPNFLLFLLFSPTYFVLFCMKIFKENIQVGKLKEMIEVFPFVIYSQFIYTLGAIQGCREFNRMKKKMVLQ